MLFAGIALLCAVSAAYLWFVELRLTLRMVDTAEWTPVDVWCSREPMPRSIRSARVVGTVRAATGQELRFAGNNTVSLDLVGAIRDGRQPHLSGPLAPGARLVLACPDVPGVGLVKVSSARR